MGVRMRYRVTSTTKEDEDEDDPFEGLTPQEIVQLKEKVERENFRK